MTQIDIVDEGMSLDSPVLVEGFPGVGLVGKMAVDHLIAAFEMDHYANVYCDTIPPVATYQEDSRQLVTPVRLYADAERDLLALQSDVPIGPEAATEFGNCVAGRFAEADGAALFRAQDAEGAPLPDMGLVEGHVAGSFAHVIDAIPN